MTKEEIEKQMWVNYDEGYKAGCSETISKACEWLKFNFNMPGDFEFHFRKAMEKQQ